MSFLSTIALHSTLPFASFLASFRLSSPFPLPFDPPSSHQQTDNTPGKKERTTIRTDIDSHSPMANHLDILAPEGREYLIEIAKHIDHAQQHHHYQSSSSGMSFTTGLLLGQLSVVLLVIVCFKYLLLEDVRYGRKVGQI